MADIQSDAAAREAYTKALHDGRAQTAVVEAQAVDTGNRIERDRDVICNSDDRWDQIQRVWN